MSLGNFDSITKRVARVAKGDTIRRSYWGYVSSRLDFGSLRITDDYAETLVGCTATILRTNAKIYEAFSGSYCYNIRITQEVHSYLKNHPNRHVNIDEGALVRKWFT